MVDFQEPLGRPNSEVPRITLSKGELFYYEDGEFSLEPPADPSGQDDYLVGMEGFAIAKEGALLEASVASCPVITMYNSISKVGALLHINVEGVMGTLHEEEIEHAIQAYPELTESDNVWLFFSRLSSDDEVLDVTYKNWIAEIDSFLKEKGIKSIKFHPHEEGRIIKLDTKTGKVKVEDDTGLLLFEADGVKRPLGGHGSK